ncbi:MAG: transcriptional regulator [Fibrobacteres bacterium]|nr:transcriptional regulator [Fibrobacterota bacterium]MBK9576977.1 transcriptional regulator [Fibrobacterota bacterium]QQS06003.1 MAG: transcriptional regulator [Fibrobacterota bacterium]
MDIKPIHTSRDHKQALKEIESLMMARKGTPEGDRLEVLSTLVEDWERRHQQILPPDPVEAIRFRMEQQGLTANDLAPLLGGANRVSEVLHRKRALTITMIRNLHRVLQIPSDVLVG